MQQQLSSHALARLLGDWRGVSGPMYARLAQRVAQLISDGRVAPGERLPAERPLSTTLGLSRNTVVRAYGVLREQRLVDSRRGAGTVARVAGEPAGELLTWSSAARLGVDGGRPLIDMSVASPGADQLIVEVVARAVQRLPAFLGDSGYHPLGIDSLRTSIAARFTRRGVETAPSQILVTAGAQQALDLVARTMFPSRETVIIESPTYPGALDAIRAAGARMISLDVSAGGWDVERFAELARQTGARAAYLIPDYQNPTGRLMPDAVRAELARVASRLAVTLIIDETLTELGLGGMHAPLPFALHDKTGSHLTIGSVSKVAWGGLRVGWIRASPTTIAALARVRAGTDLGGAVLEQLAAAEVLDDIDSIIEHRRPALQLSRDKLVSCVEAMGWTVRSPQGGLSVWAELPSGSASAFADTAFGHGVVVIAGPRLSPDGVLDRFIRLSFAMPPTALETSMQRLTAAWTQTQALLSRHHRPKPRVEV